MLTNTKKKLGEVLGPQKFSLPKKYISWEGEKCESYENILENFMKLHPGSKKVDIESLFQRNDKDILKTVTDLKKLQKSQEQRKAEVQSNIAFEDREVIIKALDLFSRCKTLSEVAEVLRHLNEKVVLQSDLEREARLSKIQAENYLLKEGMKCQKTRLAKTKNYSNNLGSQIQNKETVLKELQEQQLKLFR